MCYFIICSYFIICIRTDCEESNIMSKKSVSSCQSKQSGFTLIELMIAVVVLAILAAIAMPMYSNYITKAKARSAQSDLLALSLVLESMGFVA